MYNITIWGKTSSYGPGNAEYSDGAETRLTGTLENLPIGNGENGMDYEYTVEQNGTIIGNWYSDNADDVAHLPLA